MNGATGCVSPTKRMKIGGRKMEMEMEDGAGRPGGEGEKRTPNPKS